MRVNRTWKFVAVALVVFGGHVAALAAELADPTNPNGLGRGGSGTIIAQSEVAAVPRLDGILANGPHRLAFIDGRRVRENEQAAEYTVVKIGERTVTLRKGKEMLELELPRMVYGKAARL